MAFYFDPSSVDTSTTLPEGLYSAMITDAKDENTKAGGNYLGLELTIVSNDRYGGKKVYDKLNYKCASEKAVEIANRNIKTIIMAKFGEKRIVEHESELINTIIDIQISVEHDAYKGEEVNKVKFYKLPASKKEDVAW